MTDPFPFLEVPEWVSPARFSPCHTLDAFDRPICGATMTGARPQHSYATCESEKHEVCKTCRSLEELAR